MTRRLCIVNLSNWDGEDYEVVTSELYAAEKMTLRPGESLDISPHETAAIAVQATESKELEPFRNQDGVQVTPQMKVAFE